DAPLAVVLQLRQLVEPLHVGGQDRRERLLRSQPFAVDQTFHLNGARLVEAGAAGFLIQVAGILPPLRPRFIPGGPEPAVPIAGQADVGTKARRYLRLQNLPEFRLRSARKAAHLYAVGSLVIAVPADPDAVFLVVRRDRRVPVVGLAGADVDGVVPAVA